MNSLELYCTMQEKRETYRQLWSSTGASFPSLYITELGALMDLLTNWENADRFGKLWNIFWLPFL